MFAVPNSSLVFFILGPGVFLARVAGKPAWHPWKKILFCYLPFATLIKLVSSLEGQIGLQFRQQS